MVLDGAHGDGSRSARRHAGFVNPPLTRKPAVRGAGDWYPPSGIPAPTVVDIAGDGRPEIIDAVPVRRNARAAVRIAVDLANRGAITRSEAASYAGRSMGRNTAAGHMRAAVRSGIPDRTPNARAS